MDASEDRILNDEKERSVWGSFHRDNSEQHSTEKEEDQHLTVIELLRGKTEGWIPVSSIHRARAYEFNDAVLHWLHVL